MNYVPVNRGSCGSFACMCWKVSFFFSHLHNCPKTEVAFPERFAELDLEFHYINRDSKK